MATFAATRGRKGGRKPVITAEKLKRDREIVGKGLTVREAAVRLKVGKTALTRLSADGAAISDSRGAHTCRPDHDNSGRLYAIPFTNSYFAMNFDGAGRRGRLPCISGTAMTNHILTARLVLMGLLGAAFIVAGEAEAQQQQASTAGAESVEHIGKPVRGVPVSPAVKAGKFVFVSGTPAYDMSGKLAVGDFPAQMKQVMENITAVLKAAGADWEDVVKTNVLLIRAGDFAEMNRIYSAYFPEGKFPARTTSVVAGLPHPDFLLEIECEAILK